jgi:hypothetical protein
MFHIVITNFYTCGDVKTHVKSSLHVKTWTLIFKIEQVTLSP